ncbi:ABC transporter ATP-binding protein [Methanolapillus millepedarum]|uniref:Iron import ATP-binding/permease protein IrtA n=1 Tax=Methanolapillus millepedarum TaxID=3028296 RepID=A0AA96ZUX3_9EURY|nr:Iron import ATP-binding/permease protein IrtA [Methanosarcinaceae archaeon Ac7]
MNHQSDFSNTNQPVRKKGMKRLWELAFMQKGLVIAACILAVISIIISFSPFIAIYYIIQELLAHITNLSGLDSEYMIRLGWIAGGGALLALFLNFCALMCSHVAAFKTMYRLKLEFTEHIASLPLGFHTENSTGKLRKIVDENIEKLEGFIAHQLPDIAGSFAAPIVVLVILFVFDWRLGLASLVPVVLAYGVQMAGFSGKDAQYFLKTYQDSLEEMNNAAVEYVRGISVVKAFNQTVFSFRKFHAAIKNYGKFVFSYTEAFENIMTLFMVMINNIYLFLIPVIILLSGNVTNYSDFTLACIFYLIFSLAIPASFTKLMYVSQTGRQIADGIGRMDKILDVPTLPQTANPKTTKNYDISYEHVVFSYEGNGKERDGKNMALSDVSFTAKQGEITALVGPSGSGKSTLAHLIPRFYDVNSGAVKIGGVDIRDMSDDYLMSIVSFVFQDVFLFKQSVYDNILIGNKEATKEDIIRAAKAAQCHEFIEKLPNGYDTVIGTQNIHLSGGERQRIVIARAILKDAPIIVLDEATAFADPENEYKIQRAFEELMKDKTVIIIAHRLSTVRGADKIVVIDSGKVAEEGVHETLVKAGGRYSRMWGQYTRSLRWTLASKPEVN